MENAVEERTEDTKRKQWEIEDDYHKVKRFFELKIEIETLFKDKERLEEVQEFAKKKAELKKKTNEAIAKGSLEEALGF